MYGKDTFIIFDFSRKAEAATIRTILQGGITINGEEYQFIQGAYLLHVQRLP